MTQVFEAKYPTIKLDHISTPTDDEQTQKILAMFAANDPPEVMQLPATRDYKRVAVRRVLLDLEPYMKRDSFDINVFAPVARDLRLFCGKYYGLPMHLSFHVTITTRSCSRRPASRCRTSYVAKKRWTMGVSDDGYLEAMRKLTRGEGEKKVWGDPAHDRPARRRTTSSSRAAARSTTRIGPSSSCRTTRTASRRSSTRSTSC